MIIVRTTTTTTTINLYFFMPLYLILIDIESSYLNLFELFILYTFKGNLQDEEDYLEALGGTCNIWIFYMP